MTRSGTLIEKEPGLTAVFQGEEHAYVRCILADANDPTRQFECRVLDVEDIPTTPGQSITLEVIHVITDRNSGKVRFYCHFVA